jgi:thiol-disulfide isomerase/thioredoxin
MTSSAMNASLLFIAIIFMNYCMCVRSDDEADVGNALPVENESNIVDSGAPSTDGSNLSVVAERSGDKFVAANSDLVSNKTTISFVGVGNDGTNPKPPQLRFCRVKTFFEIVFRDFCLPLTSDEYGDNADLGGETETAGVTRRVTCMQQNNVNSSDSVPAVHIYNSSQLLAHLGSRTNGSAVGRCTVVLFYAPWCMFCVRLAPHYNALARAFPMLDIVAIDAFHFSSLNSRFGTIAVPNIMVFHNAKAVARFNGTDRTLHTIASFIANVTGITYNSTVDVLPEDFVGPLSSELSVEPDYLLVLSWLFVLCCAVVACVRSATGRRVWNTLVAIGNHGQGQHLHLD